MSKHDPSEPGPAQAIAGLPARFPRLRRALVGFSGGVDSTALLWLAARYLREQWTLSAVHVNHRLQPDADAWAAHCRSICDALDIPLRVEILSVSDAGEGLESAARIARYERIATLLDEDSVLVTAHHRDDQAETLLIQLLRGAGPRGLAAMPATRPLGAGLHLRPLLDFGRARLAGVAAEAGLATIADPMNADPRFLRARVRGELLPVLTALQPGAVATLARTADLCANTAAIVDWAVERELDHRLDADGNLPVTELTACPQVLRAELLRGWLRRQGLPMPRAAQLDELLAQVDARADAVVCVDWPGAEVRRYRGRLFATPPLAFPDPETRIEWCARRCDLPAGAGRLEWSGESLRGRRFPELVVGFRRGGERIRLAGEAQHRTLKNLFQEAGVPPWTRRRLPLIHVEGELVAVADRWVAGPLRRLESDYGLRLRFLAGGPA